MDLKNEFEKLSNEYGGETKASYIIGIQLSDIKKALVGDSEKWLEKLSGFFESREFVLSTYDEKQLSVLKSIENLIAVKGSAQKAAGLMAKSPSVISAYRKGTYAGSVETVTSDLQAYFRVKEEKSDTYKEVEYAPTSISSNVYEAIRAVQIKGGSAIVTGDPGVGKTKAIEKYAADNPTNTVVITGNSFDTTTTAVIEMLAEELGIDECGNTRRLKKLVLNKLSDGMLIIVDEAQTFRFAALDWLRSISDSFEKRKQTLGIIFIGNHCLRELFIGKNSEKHAQLSSRFLLKPRYYSQQIKLDDIKLLFPVLVVEEMTAELKFLHAISLASHVGTRTAVRLFANAVASLLFVFI